MSTVVARRDLQFVLHELLQVEDRLREIPAYGDIDRETIDQILDAAGSFAAETVQPLNRRCDELGCTYQVDGSVTTPDGVSQAYAAYCAQGWPGAAAVPEIGGQGLPQLVFSLVQEQVCAASQSFSMFTAANHCAIQCLQRAATLALQQRWLPALASGEVLATMCLSEPQAGSDLGLLRTRAVVDSDGMWRVSGTKIFVSGGEQDLSANILHLVLARLPDAPSGTRGLSLLLVPKRLDNGRRNTVRCDGIEHKMGLRGSPTCVITFDNALGWLVGDPHQGLRAMFHMMNTARLLSAIQALGVGEAAYRQAHAYAFERRQGRAAGQPPEPGGHLLVQHPDVQRMLLTQRAWNEGARALVHMTALQLDLAHGHPDPAVRDVSRESLSLLTPVAKGFICENAQAVASLALQVHGGHGYIRDTGIEQLYRDVRITSIYEGTTAIQSIDLLVRKMIPDNGHRMALLCGVIEDAIVACDAGATPLLSRFARRLEVLQRQLRHQTEMIRAKMPDDPALPYRVAHDYLRLVGHAVMASMWARMAAVAQRRIAADADPFYRAKLCTAQFYFEQVLPETQRLCAVIESPNSDLLDTLQVA